MSIALAVAVALLPGILPALAVGGRHPVTPFLVPLATAAMAAVAAVVMLATAGSLVVWFAIVAVGCNVAAVTAIPAALVSDRTPGPAWWPWASLATVVAAVSWPLLVLNAPIIETDSQAIWLLHAAMISGGHSTLVADLTNTGYLFSHPDYPPLVPAVGALLYAVRGAVDDHLALAATVSLNACVVGVAATGLLSRVPATTTWIRRTACLLLVFLLSGAIYGVTGADALNGYADLLYAGAGLGAVIYGLLLPRSPRHLAVASLCLAIAALTKNEGMLTAVIVAVLVIARQQRRGMGLRQRLATLGVALALVPGAIWMLIIRADGLSDSFFASSSGETLDTRLSATVSQMSNQLRLVLPAILVLIAGTLLLRHHRSRLGIGDWRWLWTGGIVYTLGIAATYVIGSPEINWWLNTSVVRTTIFANASLQVDMTAWLLVAICVLGDEGRTSPERPASTSAAGGWGSDALSRASAGRPSE